MVNFNESPNEPILYELLEYFVRKQEPELIVSLHLDLLRKIGIKWTCDIYGVLTYLDRYNVSLILLQKCKNDAAILSTTGTIKNALRYLNNRYSLPESISQQVSLTLPWKFAVGDCGRLLAVLQENVIEIRKAKDEYSSIVGKASVPKDAFLQWRKICWSPDGTILVLASSNGYTSFYNALGNNIFNISPKTMSQNPHILEAGDAIASIIFLKPRGKSEKWSHEILLITYSGLLKSYYISTSGYELHHEFSFGNFYKNGVNSVTYDEKNHLFYVAGNTITHKITSAALESGLTSWRPLNDYPYCKLSFGFDDESKITSRFSIWNIIPTLYLQPESIIFKIRISPNNEFLSCLHTDGSISLWALPSLLLQKKWKLVEQPDFNIPNPLGHTKSKKFPPGVTEFHPLDIGWWSNQAIIIARYSGSTSVCSLRDLKNLLGTSPEFLSGQPQICEIGPDHGFLCLDCEAFVTSKKRNRESGAEGQMAEASSESEKEDDELGPTSILNYTTNLMQSTLYSITDIERFQPKRKRSRVLFRTYRILGLKSTTPEELYSRKIDIEEYKEALTLANTYNLDTDLVYQTQWRKSELSLSAIQEHLSKVTKRSWVLHECVARVPDTIEAARELLNFGLKGANLETLVAIGVCDNGKFVIDNADEDWEEVDEASVSLRQVQKVNHLLNQIDVQNLTEAQKDLIKYRRKLLDHLDRLLTYEIILQPPLKYDKNFYEEFRQLSPVENAIRFAKNSDCQGVEIMFTYYGESLMPHWLAVISFFPETLNPLNYEKLLPECDTDGQLFLHDQRELRQKDWSEKTEFNEVIQFENDDKSQLLYETDPSLSAYRETPLTPQLLQEWYKSRAYQIERNSFMVDNALQLIKIAKSHNINGLEELLLDLETLDDLVYKVCIEDLSLDQLQKLTNLEKIQLLMSITTEKSFVDDIKNFLLPFIIRRHQYLGGELQRHLFSDYLICISTENLQFTVKFFEYLIQTQDSEVLQMINNTATLALDCIYACNDPSMFEKAKCILDSISKDRTGRRTSAVSTLLEELERELECAKILNKYGVKSTLKSLRKNKSDPESAKMLLIQMARSLNKIIPPPDEKQWTLLLNEMLEIHGMIFTCVDIEICFEICVSARLVSGIKSNIQNCAALIETKKNEQSLLKVSYEKAVCLILDASKEYFNSSKCLTDPNMELAKACLHLIADDNPQIKEEYELINSLQILNEFNIDILPLHVRLTQNRLKLIEDCLNKREDAHKSRQRLLTLASYLRIEESNSRAREGKVLELIAKKALEVKDYSVCAATCMQLIQNTYIPAWTVALNLGYCEDYQDLKTRQKCLWFAINNGPSDILGEALVHMHLIEIQMLHKNLELWIPSTENDDFNEVDSEDEFIDAMTTPQMETKEFVPKMFETSTEIVKTSANIMKESFGLIKNIGDANFWKSRLKFNFTNTVDTDTYNDDENQEENTDVQSFPCFYESLHDRCRLSNLDARYTYYSMPEVQNVKLKCCRAFLRIAMLSESSCYGLEVSDINHLFLECAKHTISEDWLLSLAYLFSLKKNCLNEAQNIFTELPETELCVQTATYYYSLELHKKLHKDFRNLYLFKPSHLIRKVIANAAMNTLEECDIQKALKHWQARLLSHRKFKDDTASNEVPKEPARSFDLKPITNENQNTVANTTNSISEKFSESNVNDDMEWTNDWDNFSDDDAMESFGNGQPTPEGYLETMSNRSLVENIGECSTEKDRYETFEKLFERIRTSDHYHEIKKLLLQWPKFNDLEYTGINKHPSLRMMKIVDLYVTKQNTKNYDNQVLEEYRELLQSMCSMDVIQEFLKTNKFPFEHGIYVRLHTNNTMLHEEAVNILKEKRKETKLSAPILEMLFRKDLTAHFDPNHNVYKQIIEHVFVNQSITDIKHNTEVLLRELKKQKHIGHALSIIRLTGDIPGSLSTFNTCYKLLMRK